MKREIHKIGTIVCQRGRDALKVTRPKSVEGISREKGGGGRGGKNFAKDSIRERGDGLTSYTSRSCGGVAM